MIKIWLNDEGKKIFPWLANEWHSIYGCDFDPKYKHFFIIWDNIYCQWRKIPLSICEGGKNEEN